MLGDVTFGGGGPVGAEQVAEADAVDARLRHVLDLVGRLDPHQFEHGGHDVDGVDELMADASGPGRESGRPRDDAGIGDTALVHLALPALEGRVARHGPSPRVVVVGERSTDLVQTVVHLGETGGVKIGHPDVVDRSLRSTFGAGAVVRDQDEDGVVELARLLEECHQATDLGVGVREESGEALHEPAGHGALELSELVPRRHPRRPGREACAGGITPRASCRA